MPIESRSEVVAFRLTPDELRLLEDAAKAKREKVGVVARDVLVKWAKRVMTAV